MIRLIVWVAASLLLIGNVFAEDKGKKVESEKKPEAKVETVKKESTEAKTEPTSPPAARKRGLRNEASGHRGKATKVSIENGTIKVTVDGKEHEFTISENTHAMLRTTEKDGKEVVVGLSFMNADGRKRAATTRQRKKGDPK